MAESDPFPSGGLAVARVAELAASLAAAVAEHSRGGWPEAGGARAQAEALGRRAGELGERGVGEYVAARHALADRVPNPGSAPAGESQSERDRRLGAAVGQAAEVPLELAARAADIALLAGEIAIQAPGDVRTDAVIAALLAAAAARAAARLVQINLAVGDGVAAAIARDYADSAATAAAAAEVADA